jgi:flagellar hook-associated protein 1 FlgK
MNSDNKVITFDEKDTAGNVVNTYYFTEQNDKAVAYYLNANGVQTVVADPTTVTGLDDALKDAKSASEMSGVLFSNQGDGNETDGITAANISVSQDWATGQTRIFRSFTSTVEDQDIPSTANDNILHFVNLINEKLAYNPNTVLDSAPDQTMFTGTFQEMFVRIESVLGNDIDSTTIMYNSYDGQSVELDTSRDSVSGVDLNDEAMNLMQYQKAYAAACRLMTVLDDVLETLIEGTAV